MEDEAVYHQKEPKKKEKKIKPLIKTYGQGTINTLFVMGWIFLILGIIGSLAIWEELAVSGTVLERTIDPVGIIASVSTFLFSVAISFLFFGMAVIGQNLISINQKQSNLEGEIV